MIRPSMLAMAEKCGLAPVLAEKYPESSEAAERGKVIHAEIARALKADDKTDVPEARAAIAWLREYLTGEIRVEQPAKLFDPDTMQVVTEGTPDVVAGPRAEGGMAIVDWKTGRPENVPDVDDNLQLLAYGLAVAQGRKFRMVLVFLDGEDFHAFWSLPKGPEEHPSLLARVKRAASREPSATTGPHCGSCYQRQYCHARLAQMRTAMAVLPEPGLLQLDEFLVTALSEHIDLAEDWLKAAKAARADFVRSGGVCRVGDKVLTLAMRAGRETADVKALKAAGLGQYVKQGEPYEFPTWKKVKE